MEPTVTRAFVTPMECLPYFTIYIGQFVPTNLSEQNTEPIVETELSDTDVLSLIKEYRLPTTDQDRWAF
jgi:hypothetical protein